MLINDKYTVQRTHSRVLFSCKKKENELIYDYTIIYGGGTLLTKTLKLLGDETRLRIVTLLEECPCFVTDIHTILDLQQSNTSRHLQRLLDLNIIQRKKCGQSICYYIDQGKHPYSSLIHDVVTIYKQTDQAKVDFLHLIRYMNQHREMIQKMKEYMNLKEKYYA